MKIIKKFKKQLINKPKSIAYMRSRNKTTEMPRYSDDDMIKIAVVQGGAWGDNINSTLMLKPLKEHYPNSVIDIHTSNIYHDAFKNNPLINKLIKHEVKSKNDAINLALSVPAMILQSNYDIVISHHPIFNTDWSSKKHPEWGENLIFAWVRALENIDIACDSLETILQLLPEEIAKVDEFIKQIPGIDRFKNLIETHGESGQTFYNPLWTKTIIDKLASQNQIVFISKKGKSGEIIKLMEKYPNNVFFAGDLSIRECAELYNNCDRFFSVSSGLSNACNTNWCKNDIQWIEIVNSTVCSSAAVRSEGKTFWYENNLQKFLKEILE